MNLARLPQRRQRLVAGLHGHVRASRERGGGRAAAAAQERQRRAVRLVHNERHARIVAHTRAACA